MDQSFGRKIREAAVAGWWTVLIASAILLVQWLAYLAIMAWQPEGIRALWGSGVTWPEIRAIWLWGILAYKLIVAVILFAVIWLTLWARRLNGKQSG